MIVATMRSGHALEVNHTAAAAPMTMTLPMASLDVLEGAKQGRFSPSKTSRAYPQFGWGRPQRQRIDKLIRNPSLNKTKEVQR